MEERGLAAHPRHRDRLTALDDPTRDALAHAVATVGEVEPDRRSDGELVPLAKQRDRRAHRVVMLLEQLEDAIEPGLELHRVRHRLADLEEALELANLVDVRAHGVIMTHSVNARQ